MILIKQDKIENKFNNFFKKILIIAIIITSIFSYMPIASFAENEEETSEDDLYPALVPAFADAIISKFVSTNIYGTSGGSNSSGSDVITDYSETGDGWDSITTVNYPNGVTRTFRNYKQNKGSYAGKYFYRGNISNSGCGATSLSIILSGYGIDADPGEIVDIFQGRGYDYSYYTILQEVLKEEFNIDSEAEKLTSSSIQHIRDNFNAGRPIITGVPNHFITYLGEDSNGDIILSDPFYDTSYGKTLEDYVGTYGNRGFDLLLIKSDGNATQNGTSKSNNSNTNKKSNNTNNNNSSGTALRWPIGSEEISTKNGKKFATGTPAIGLGQNVSRGGVSQGWSGENHTKGNGEALDIAGNGQSNVYNVIAMGSGTVTSCGEGIGEGWSEGNRRNG